ncbi:MAG: hypothetical protein IKW45_04280 [Clostridia bacterium]|nr:hypothetical protein [Clostridia bacterium]
MKKMIAILLSTFIILSSLLSITVFAKDNVQLKLTDATVYAGDEFTLKLFISDNSELSGAVVDLSYDSNLLEFLSADVGTILDQNASINIKNFENGSFVRFTYMSPSNSVTSAGILLNLKFKALEAAEGRTSVKISIPNSGDFVNSKLEEIPFEVVNSNIRILNSTKSDAITTETSATENSTENKLTETTTVIENPTETNTEPVQKVDDKAQDGSLKIVYGLIATGIVLLIGAIAYVVISKKKKR